ncbi:MAG: DPP IV N-terminal domain-containing protein [Bacteroidota bacterium]
MDENGTEGRPDDIQVTLASTQYMLTEGGSADIEVLLANLGPSDFFIVNLLGIPPGWISTAGPSAVWVASGGQERVVINVRPPAADGLVGSYPGRLYVFSQGVPERGREIPIVLIIQPEARAQKTFVMNVETTERGAAPGTTVKIPLLVSSSSPRTEFLELSVEGVPATWVSLPSPVVTLQAGEDKVVDLFLQVPASPEIRAGRYPIKITLVSQKDPAIREEVTVRLIIAAFESQGLVGVMLRSVQFAAAPGGSFTIPLTVLNRGLVPATFRLGVEGIPVSWISTSTPVTALKPGESREIAILVRPPLSPASQAGRRKFRIVVISQEAPDQVVKVDCILTLAAYTRFSTTLEPQTIDAGEMARVLVRNEGNTHQAFRISCVSDGNRLVFGFYEPEGAARSPAQDVTAPTAPPAPVAANGGPISATPPALDPTVLHIPPGEAGAFRFTAKPRQRPWMGGAANYPYQATVSADHQQSPVMPGEVVGRGLIPVWILAIFLILCLWFAFSATFALFGNRFQSNSATQTAIAGTQQVIGATQTIIANQTAAAAAGQQDTDGDGLTNQQEAQIGTDPNNADTDRDGLLDGMEVNQTHTNPLVPDSDGDGLLDGDEVNRGTNPLNADTDGDGLRDGDEVRIGTNPLKQDTDGDGLLDGQEPGPCPNPLNPDSDGDGIIDGKDLNPCDPANPSLTGTAVASRPTPSFTPPPVPTAVVPTQTFIPAPTVTMPPIQPLPSFQGLILFDSNRDGNPEIYAIDSASRMTRMTNNPASDTQGVWDPNMQRIAFTSNRNGQNDIYIQNADGSNTINLTNNLADDQQPAWSSDGQWILFTSNRDGNYEIYEVRLSNLETHNLTNNPGSDSQPSWIRNRSKDLSGDYILFTSNRDGNNEIYRMKSDGSGAINLTNSPASDQMAKGSPDGSLVAFTSDRTGNQDVYSMQLDGQGLTDLTNNPASDFGPVWSSDQIWIAYTSDRSGNRDVYIQKPGIIDASDVTNSPSSQDQVSDWR